MNIFFDTSVLVAAFSNVHPHYPQAFPAVEKVDIGQDKGFICAHSIAEIYSALTRLPVDPPIKPADAERIISQSLLPIFQIIPLEKDDYLAALRTVRNGGWSGAKIYDALLLCCAAKCDVSRVYTFNLSDFRLLAPKNLRAKICAP